eukprot:scaffold12420_cov24-Cyclotella_meneghiniana.AAC.2
MEFLSEKRTHSDSEKEIVCLLQVTLLENCQLFKTDVGIGVGSSLGVGFCVGKNNAVGLSVGVTGFGLGSGLGGSVNAMGDNDGCCGDVVGTYEGM